MGYLNISFQINSVLFPYRILFLFIKLNKYKKNHEIQDYLRYYSNCQLFCSQQIFMNS